MNDEKEIIQRTLGELKKTTSIRPVITEALKPYSIVIFYSSDASGSGGSGTLVEYKGIKGILTANHVAAPIFDKKVLFLPVSFREATKDVWDIEEVPFCRILTIDQSSVTLTEQNDCWSEEDLDIALIQLDDETFDKIIEQRAWQPLNLAKMKNTYHSQEYEYWSPENKNNWIHAIAGFPRHGTCVTKDNIIEMPHAGPYLGGGESKIRFNTLKNVISPFCGMEVDLIFKEIGETTDLLPESFKGLSGGGAYQIRGQPIDGEFKLDEVFLAGVFVAASEGCLYSRGSIALYDIFCKFLDNELISE